MANLVSRIGAMARDYFTLNHQVVEYASVLPGQIYPNINALPPVYSDSNVEAYINKGYCDNASIFTIVNKGSKKFSHITRGVYAVTDKKAARTYKSLTKKGLTTPGAQFAAQRLFKKAYSGEAVENDLSKLLMRPNKWQGQDSFFQLAKIFYMLTGEAFIWLNRGEDPNTRPNQQGDDVIDDMDWKLLPVLEMYILPSQAVELIPDPFDIWNILGYWFTVNGKRLFVRAVDVVHWKTPNPQFDTGTDRRHLRGISPLRPGKKVWAMDDQSTDALVAMYKNGGAKMIVYDKSMSKLTPLQESQMANTFREKVNNPVQKAAVAALQGDWGGINIGLSSVDMQLVDGNEKAFIALCNLFDVPPELFVPDQKFSNKEVSIKSWLTNSVIPESANLRDELNLKLLIAFKISASDMTIDHDISDIPELQSDLKEMVGYLAQTWWFSPNLRREYMNEEPDPADGMDEIWMPSNLVRMGDNLDAVTSQLQDNGTFDEADNTDNGIGSENSSVGRKAFSDTPA